MISSKEMDKTRYRDPKKYGKFINISRVSEGPVGRIVFGNVVREWTVQERAM